MVSNEILLHSFKFLYIPKISWHSLSLALKNKKCLEKTSESGNILAQQQLKKKQKKNTKYPLFSHHFQSPVKGISKNRKLSLIK